MNRPSLYSRASEVQRHDGVEIAKEYADVLEKHSAGKQSLLDVGSGSGDVLVEIIAPVLARGFTKVTGIDISHEMVEYSEKRYAHLEGVSFKQLNIETDELPPEFYGKYDRVTAFYCLHWIHDHRKSLENVFKSLRKNGDCLLIFPTVHASPWDAYRALKKDPRWEVYIKDEIFPNSFLCHPEIEKECGSLLQQVGFVEWKVEVKNKAYTYEGITQFKENMKAINVFLLPPSVYEEYFDALCDCFIEMGLGEKIPGTEDYRVSMKYELVVAYARKGE